MNNNMETQPIIKEKKIYVSNSKNDLYQKRELQYFTTGIIKSALYAYTGDKKANKDMNKFLTYFNKRTKQQQNKSKNDINYRIERIYNYITSIYSDFVELSEIINDVSETNLNPNETK